MGKYHTQFAESRPPAVKLDGFGKSRTRQSEAAACDINNIMAKYEKTGVIPQDQREAFFSDVSEMADYRTSLDQIRVADGYFMSLPAKVRSEFANDTATFLDALQDPESLDLLKELGIVEKDAVGDPPIPPVVSESLEETDPPAVPSE